MGWRFLALLRGINVGGNNLIAKDQLRDTFEALGFCNVRTYIQSGNVLFRATDNNPSRLTKVIEDRLSERFSYPARAVVISSVRYAAALRAAPSGWGTKDTQRHNALFVLGGITSAEALAALPTPKRQYESVTTGPGVIFWSASKVRWSRTAMAKVASEPMYQHLTVRNHNTVFKLGQLLGDI